jgi:hypothetical protein
VKRKLFAQPSLLGAEIMNDKGADDMNDRDEWISYSHWGMFLTGTKK